LQFEANDRRAGDKLSHSVDVASAICNHCGFSPKDQNNGAPSCAGIDRFEICVKDQYWLLHETSLMRPIIA
jgi:hypothetical protein